ncbi:radical SAM protein [Streptomyces sp. NBC_00257]|uniref:radical SAM protein n=1 Tax=unclassified Streptomyces TaxID=2593676 RepID=UPI00224E9CF1|nr:MULTISPECIES: radical SAM protein [unclassified Streptomyces]MCX5431574.1 radical SAM protein [Streptomyces sp. NBC_00062]
MTTVRTALISTAGHCKVACGFCFRADRAHGFLDIATYTRVLSRLKEADIKGVCLTGGEPSHHPQLRQLIRLTHQFGLPVSVVTSARTVAEVTVLEPLAPLLSGVTVSADSRGAMLLGRTQRSMNSGLATLRALAETSTRILHVTCWDLTDAECRDLADQVATADVEVQFSPVVLDERSLLREGLSRQDAVTRQQYDANILARNFRLSDRYRAYLTELRDLQLDCGQQEPWSCRSSAAYVTAEGDIRRCPYGVSSVSVHAPRSTIQHFLTTPPRDRVTPDCAAICRPAPADGSDPNHTAARTTPA